MDVLISTAQMEFIKSTRTIPKGALTAHWSSPALTHTMVWPHHWCGDLEILGYCMIQWLSACLPWEDNMKDPNYVRDSKIRYRGKVAALMEKCFPEKNKLGEITKYMESVTLLDCTKKPLYQNLCNILLQGLKAIGSKDDGKLDFSAVENGSVKTKPASRKWKKEAEESMVCTVEDVECSDTQVQEAAQTHSRRQQHLELQQDMLGLDHRGSQTRKKAQK